jgi:hypothetical protein
MDDRFDWAIPIEGLSIIVPWPLLNIAYSMFEELKIVFSTR